MILEFFSSVFFILNIITTVFSMWLILFNGVGIGYILSRFFKSRTQNKITYNHFNYKCQGFSNWCEFLRFWRCWLCWGKKYTLDYELSRRHEIIEEAFEWCCNNLEDWNWSNIGSIFKFARREDLVAFKLMFA